MSQSSSKGTECISYQQIYWGQQWLWFVTTKHNVYCRSFQLCHGEEIPSVICDSFSHVLGFQDWYLAKIYCHEIGEMIFIFFFWSGVRSGSCLCCCTFPVFTTKKNTVFNHAFFKIHNCKLSTVYGKLNDNWKECYSEIKWSRLPKIYWLSQYLDLNL